MTPQVPGWSLPTLTMRQCELEPVQGAVCGPPRSVYEIVGYEAEPERWCYGERQRRTGVHILLRPRMEWVHATLAYGWAEPIWQYRCDGCGQDRRWMW